ncbi:MAG: tRNA glutamyl-Q synthetase [Bernardetiaceae bacterium]|nr:tRNA glutamyl-Q synthetase [Bernardetiaceae bacterium]
MMKLTRIAPTPSGFLHLGNAYSFLLTYLIAQKTGAKILLRIDDLDKARKRPEYVEDIFKSLEWLGITYEKGAQSVEDFEQNYTQHKRLDLYEQALENLVQQEKIYACYCSRKQITKRSPLLYDRFCLKRALSLDTEKAAWRIKNKDIVVSFEDQRLGNIEYALHEKMPDFVLRRKDKFPAYQLASLVDDLHFGVDTIVRGSDLISSTAAQVFLASQIQPAASFVENKFYHHPLLRNRYDTKLSKSKGDISLRFYRKEGRCPLFIYKAIAQSMGWNANLVRNLADLTTLAKTEKWNWKEPLLQDFDALV